MEPEEQELIATGHANVESAQSDRTEDTKQSDTPQGRLYTESEVRERERQAELRAAELCIRIARAKGASKYGYDCSESDDCFHEGVTRATSETVSDIKGEFGIDWIVEQYPIDTNQPTA